MEQALQGSRIMVSLERQTQAPPARQSLGSLLDQNLRSDRPFRGATIPLPEGVLCLQESITNCARSKDEALSS